MAHETAAILENSDMKRRFIATRNTGVLLLIIAGALACSATPSPPAGEAPAAEAQAPQPEFSGTVVSVTNVSRYTYVCVNADGREIWAAAPQFDVRPGETVIVPPSIPMKNFSSPALARTFDELCFVSSIVVVGREAADPFATLPEGHPSVGGMGAGHHGTPVDLSDMDFSGIETPDGGKTVAEVNAQRQQLAGETVTVRGKVVKFTPDVMGKNWIHIKDGSGNGNGDLTLTTEATVAIGDVITARGLLTVDRDFGHGYAYDVLLEDATLH